MLALYAHVCVCVRLLDDDVNVFFICHYVNKFSPHFNFNLTERGWVEEWVMKREFYAVI